MALDPAVQVWLEGKKVNFPILRCHFLYPSSFYSVIIARRVNGSTKLSSRTNQHLRHVEKDILIPKIMREKAKERCSEQVQDFTKCCKNSGVLMVVKCRKENSALKECLTAYYNDPAFNEECKMEYLKEREEFRKTGIPVKKRLQKVPTSM
ncbi:COX assembly mitochondrial protein homolog isoform X1 [Theropithecus gelada]|uniref:COX assembly mitochondrial protein homolog isoform X1 n=2 Tax=Theropithecus gelada TaxID=9565 RepID=UPI000DC16B52|nr:COX assembly mitochondrial protein homolog isoform X1 [Theropithecus gelada]